MDVNQKIFILSTGFIFLLIVIDLVRRRKMLEQYSALWILIGIGCLSVIWLMPLLEWLNRLIGAGSTTSTILFIGVFMSLLLNLQLSLKITDFSFKIKNLVQEISILTNRIQELEDEKKKLEDELDESPY